MIYQDCLTISVILLSIGQMLIARWIYALSCRVTRLGDRVDRLCKLKPDSRSQMARDIEALKAAVFPKDSPMRRNQ